MTGFTQVETYWQHQYNQGLDLAVQQIDSRFKPYSTHDSYTGSEGARPKSFVAKKEARRRTERHGDTPIGEAVVEGRWIEPEDYEVEADLIDDIDVLRTAIQPNSAYQRAHAAAMAVEKDRVWLTHFFGTNKVGKRGSSTKAFDTNNVVGVGATPHGLTVDKLRQARKLMRKKDIDLSREMCCVAITAEDEEDLLADIAVTSRDFNGGAAPLVTGDIFQQKFLGFHFVHCEVVDEADFLDANGYRRLPAWCMSGVHIGDWKQMSTVMSIRPDKRNSLQIYTTATCGATRLEEDKCFEIKTTD